MNEFRLVDDKGNPLTEWRPIPAKGIVGELRKVEIANPHIKRIDGQFR